MNTPRPSGMIDGDTADRIAEWPRFDLGHGELCAAIADVLADTCRTHDLTAWLIVSSLWRDAPSVVERHRLLKHGVRHWPLVRDLLDAGCLLDAERIDIWSAGPWGFAAGAVALAPGVLPATVSHVMSRRTCFILCGDGTSGADRTAAFLGNLSDRAGRGHWPTVDEADTLAAARANGLALVRVIDADDLAPRMVVEVHGLPPHRRLP